MMGPRSPIEVGLTPTPTDPNNTHLKDSHRGLSKHIEDKVADIYKLLARGEKNGRIDPTSVPFRDSNRHLAELLAAIAIAIGAKLPEPPP
jgi:hypothetical protein